MRQLNTFNLSPTELQMRLKKLVDESFSQHAEDNFMQNSTGKYKDKTGSELEHQLALASSYRPAIVSHSKNDDVLSIRVWGGVDLVNHRMGNMELIWVISLSTLQFSYTFVTQKTCRSTISKAFISST